MRTGAEWIMVGVVDSLAQAYALENALEKLDHSLIRGTIVVFGSYARILIDCEVLHSFISTQFCRAFRPRTELMPYTLHVGTQVSGVVGLREVCRGCALTIADGHSSSIDSTRHARL